MALMYYSNKGIQGCRDDAVVVPRGTSRYEKIELTARWLVLASRYTRCSASSLYDRVVLLGLGGLDDCQTTAVAVAFVVLVSSGHGWARKINGLFALMMEGEACPQVRLQCPSVCAVLSRCVACILLFCTNICFSYIYSTYLFFKATPSVRGS